ncbi:MAG: hypothetical protein KDI55_14160, partial [Anaerolineae bacterium]|nr:hypothetical protein [Anaerolineae bacterium]
MGVLKPKAVAEIEAEVMAEIDTALDDALRAPYPEPEAALEHVFAPGTPGDRYVKSWRVDW